MEDSKKKQFKRKLFYFCISLILLINFDVIFAQEAKKVVSSYGPVNQDVSSICTMADVVEYFNLVQELRLTAQEKASLVAFVRTL